MAYTKIKRTELPGVKKFLLMKQGYICPICGKSLIGVADINIVVDHDHNTGIVRAALHRGCNRVEGAVLKTITQWGKAIGMTGVLQTLERLLVFWKLHATPQTDWIHYTHKTKVEQLLLASKRRKRRVKDARNCK